MNQTERDDIKEQIRKRDGYKCRECGFPQSENIVYFGSQRRIRKLEVHRIIADAEYSFENCKTLCRSCHARQRRDYELVEVLPNGRPRYQFTPEAKSKRRERDRRRFLLERGGVRSSCPDNLVFDWVALMLARSWSVDDVADFFGVTRWTAERWITGESYCGDLREQALLTLLQDVPARVAVVPYSTLVDGRLPLAGSGKPRPRNLFAASRKPVPA